MRLLRVGAVAVIVLIVLGVAAVLLVGSSDDGHMPISSGKDTGSGYGAWEWNGQSWAPKTDPPPCTDELDIAMPVDESKVTGILYPGQYRGGDYRPHGGFRFDASKPEDITVRAPADAYVYLAARYTNPEGDNVQYMIDMMAPCGILYRFDHLVALSPKLQNAAAFLPSPRPNDSRGHFLPEPVFVERGEVLANSVGFGNFSGRPNVFVDFGVYDVRQKNEAAQQPDWPSDDYGLSEVAPYGLCWLDLLPSPLPQQLRSLPAGNEGSASDYCE